MKNLIIGLALLVMSLPAFAVSSGGCTGSTVYASDGRFLGYQINSTDKVVGRWLGSGFGTHMLPDPDNWSETSSGVMQLQVSTTGAFDGTGHARQADGDLAQIPVFYGMAYCIVKDRVYSAWNNADNDNGVGFLFIMDPSSNAAAIVGINSNAVSDFGVHEQNTMFRFAPSINLTDYWVLLWNQMNDQ